MDRRAVQFVEAARRHEGLPFAHKGRDGALDCLGLVAKAYRDAFGKFEIDWPDYGAPWQRAAHQGMSHRFLARIFDAFPIGPVRHGDVLIFDMGQRRHWHMGIAEGHEYFWHAHLRRGVEREKLSDVWQRKLETIYRITEVTNGDIGI